MEKCPRCHHISVESHQKSGRKSCLIHACGWSSTSDKKTLSKPIESPLFTRTRTVSVALERLSKFAGT